MTEFFPDAYIVLTGGHGRRLGDADKAALVLGGRTLLDRALATIAGRRVVLVGPHRVDRPGATTTIEDPPGGGPAAGVVAGLAALAGDAPGAGPLIGILAIDQVGVVADTWRRLARAVAEGGASGAVLIDDGRRQYGVGVYSRPALSAAIGARPVWHGVPLRALLDPLIGAEVAASDAEARDIDTPDDLAWWRKHDGDTP